MKHRDELASLIARQTAKLQSKELLDTLRKEHVPAGRIMNLKEVFETERAPKLILKELINGIPTARITSCIFTH